MEMKLVPEQKLGYNTIQAAEMAFLINVKGCRLNRLDKNKN